MPIIQNLLVEDATLPPALPYMTPYTVSGQASAGVSPSPVFSPLDIPGIALWLRADLGITLATGVSSWADQSGNGNNVTQATGSKQPTLVASDGNFGGQASLSFLGSSSQFLASATWGTSLGSPSTWYVVARTTTAATTYFMDGQAVGNRNAILQNGSQTALRGGVTVYPTVTCSSLGTASVFCFVMNGSSSIIYQNSSSGPLGTALAMGTGSMLGMNVGITYDSTSNPLTGSIAEIAGYSGAHTVAQVAQFFAYATARYGV